MAKVFIDCSDLNDIEAINRAAEQVVGKCDVTYYRQHEAMIDAGKSKSERESARILAEESGETFNAVHNRIRRGKKRVCQPDTVEKPEPKAIIEPDRIEIGDILLMEVFHPYFVENDIDMEKDPLKWLVFSYLDWLRADEESIFFWYAEAFKKFGKDAPIADGWRAGYLGCQCEKCQGKICYPSPVRGTTMTPRLNETLSDRGYINYRLTMKHWNSLKRRFEKLCERDAA